MVRNNTNSSILIVDDDLQVRNLIHCILSEENYNVQIANCGKEAINRKDLKSIDLILLDINMPGINGYDLCHLLKDSSDTKEIPVIFLTGNTLPEEIVKGFDCGATDYITKPFNGCELIARVRNHLDIKHSRDSLKEMALKDGLTKLFNHSYMHDRLSEEISKTRRHSLKLSLIMIDLDNFKQINDTYGHKLGDSVLKKVSATIFEMIREEDIPGRYGGEEFLIILPNTDHSSALGVAEKIRKAVKALLWEPETLNITLSGGVSSYTNETVNEFIEKTDLLLYKAKNSGKDRIISENPIDSNDFPNE